MTSFEEADTNNTGSIEKHEWDLLLLEDKRRRIEDEDAHRDQTRKMAWFALWECYFILLVSLAQVRLAWTTHRQSLAAWLPSILFLLLAWFLSLWV